MRTSTPPLQALAPGQVPTVALGGVPVGRLGMDDTLALFGAWLEDPAFRRVATANLDFLHLAHGNPDLRAALATADLVTADGEPLVWLSRWLGRPIAERVAGADFVPLLVAEAARRGRSVYFLGGEEGVAEATVRLLTDRHPELRVAGWSSPMVDLADEAGCEALAREVAGTGADLLLVALGCPKQDLFLERFGEATGARMGVGIGGTFNFIIGRVRRAPAWVQSLGLEWVFRLAMEPRRLLGRYLRDGLHFLRLLAGVALARLTPRVGDGLPASRQ